MIRQPRWLRTQLATRGMGRHLCPATSPKKMAKFAGKQKFCGPHSDHGFGEVEQRLRNSGEEDVVETILESANVLGNALKRCREECI